MKLVLVLGWFWLIQLMGAPAVLSKSAEEWYSIGFEQAEMGATQQAIDSFQKALKTQRDWPEAHHHLAVLYFRLKDGVRAVFHLREAEKQYLKRSDPLARRNLEIVRKNLRKTYAKFDLDPKEFEELESLHPPSRKDHWELTGKGFILGNQGYVLTLLHSVNQAKNIRIRFLDNSTFPARLIRSFIVYNLAVLKINPPRQIIFSGFRLGDSSQLKVGDPVFTLEYPEPSQTEKIPDWYQGKVMALSAVQDDENFFELHLPAARTLSGGPLLNSFGEVVGIILSREETAIAFQARGRLPKGELALKASYLRRVLSAMPGLRVLSSKLSSRKNDVNSSRENLSKTSRDVQRSLVYIEVSR